MFTRSALGRHLLADVADVVAAQREVDDLLQRLERILVGRSEGRAEWRRSPRVRPPDDRSPRHTVMGVALSIHVTGWLLLEYLKAPADIYHFSSVQSVAGGLNVSPMPTNGGWLRFGESTHRFLVELAIAKPYSDARRRLPQAYETLVQADTRARATFDRFMDEHSSFSRNLVFYDDIVYSLAGLPAWRVDRLLWRPDPLPPMSLRGPSLDPL